MIMNITYKKWFSILGLSMAILISLFVGIIFNLSILEGLEENSPSVEKSIYEEENPEIFDESSYMNSPGSSELYDNNPIFLDTPVYEEEEPTDEEIPDTTNTNSPSSEPFSKMKKNNEDVYKKIMDTETKESFSVKSRF